MRQCAAPFSDFTKVQLETTKALIIIFAAPFWCAMLLRQCAASFSHFTKVQMETTKVLIMIFSKIKFKTLQACYFIVKFKISFNI